MWYQNRNSENSTSHSTHSTSHSTSKTTSDSTSDSSKTTSKTTSDSNHFHTWSPSRYPNRIQIWFIHFHLQCIHLLPFNPTIHSNLHPISHASQSTTDSISILPSSHLQTITRIHSTQPTPI
eukprot:NODE_143_length_15882_cov_1.296585.p12 type:complete len:122 gc:universal NODE_143_length_15882_cov_1.296585:547-182(-)